MSSAIEMIQQAARWYLRRRRIVRVTIFFIIFVLPMVLYAYTHVPPRSELIKKYAVNATMSTKPEAKINLPRVDLRDILAGHGVYYITNFSYRDGFFKINDTAYLYITRNNKYGLLLIVGKHTSTLFVLSKDYNTTVRAGNTTYNINVVTLVLPATPPAHTSLPRLVKEIICEYVGEYNTPYDAFIHRSLPAMYKRVCS